MAHTPGPWHVFQQFGVNSICSEDNTILAVVEKWEGDCRDEEAANADLLAAAPILLEACMAVVANWESGDLAAAAQQCAAAIGRAKGGE